MEQRAYTLRGPRLTSLVFNFFVIYQLGFMMAQFHEGFKHQCKGLSEPMYRLLIKWTPVNNLYQVSVSVPTAYCFHQYFQPQLADGSFAKRMSLLSYLRHGEGFHQRMCPLRFTTQFKT